MRQSPSIVRKLRVHGSLSRFISPFSSVDSWILNLACTSLPALVLGSCFPVQAKRFCCSRFARICMELKRSALLKHSPHGQAIPFRLCENWLIGGFLTVNGSVEVGR